MKPVVILLTLLMPFSGFAAPISVKYEEAEVIQGAKPIYGSGMVVNRSEQTLGFKIGGLIKTLNVQAGQTVRAGQTLASLDLGEIDAELAKARSVVKRSLKDYERAVSLRQRELISDELLQQAETAYTVAKSDLKIAEFNRKYAVIKAPASGKILRVNVEQNEWLLSGQAVFLFAADQSGWVVKLGLADKDVVRLNLGDMAEVSLDAFPERKLQARVLEVSGQSDPRSHTFSVELGLINTPERMLSGLIAHTKIYSSQTQPVVLLPLTSLLKADNQFAQVWVIDENQIAQKRDVVIAYMDQERVAISSGIDQGERVVTEGAPFVKRNTPLALTLN